MSIERIPDDALNMIRQVLGRDAAEIVDVILRGGEMLDVIGVIRRQYNGEQIAKMFGV